MQQMNNSDGTPQAIVINNSGGMGGTAVNVNYPQPYGQPMQYAQPQMNFGQPIDYNNNMFSQQNQFPQYPQYPQQHGPIYIQNM